MRGNRSSAQQEPPEGDAAFTLEQLHAMQAGIAATLMPVRDGGVSWIRRLLTRDAVRGQGRPWMGGG